VLDHLAYGVPDLDAACHELEERLGVRPEPGGQHRGLGTHNAILALGEGVYLEVIAPDPNQPAPSRPRPFGLDALVDPRLAAWAAKAPDIESRVERARAAGYDPGNVIGLGRDLPDGGRLQWRLTFPDELDGDGLVPFLIDWGSALHPSVTAQQGCTLLSLRGEHPQPELVKPLLQALEVDLDVARGRAAVLIATLQSPNGEVQLR
jgi:hypothetical protein